MSAQMDQVEQRVLEALKTKVRAAVRTATKASWADRKKTVSKLLEAANATWWKIHSSDPDAYERDLDRLNTLTGWTGQYKQVAFWQPLRGPRVLMPPKFFGGDAGVLRAEFVASMSLNHAILPATNALFQEELLDQQDHSSAVAAHSEYFLRSYAYERFFRPRGTVLHAYSTKLGVRKLPPLADWKVLNNQLAFYIEAFPTRSFKFKLPTWQLSHTELEQQVFVCAVNSVVRDFVLQLLRPTRVLLAGKATWDAWPDPGLAEHGNDLGARVRQRGKTCRVYHYRGRSDVNDAITTIVRCCFLRTVYGPNSGDELHRFGRDVLAV